jgi:hypothetical protein
MGIVLDPTKCSPSHPSEEILEEYLFHRLPEALIPQVEEYLLVCHSCQDALEEADQFASDLKAAAEHPDLEQYPAPAHGPAGSGRGNVLYAIPRLAASASMATILVLAMVVFLVVRRPSPEPSAPEAVFLSSLRGLDPLSPAPAGKPLQLHLEAPDLATGKQYRVEVVDAAGRPVWKGPVTATGNKIVANLPKQLETGVYWVRLYGADTELLREFGMSVK